MVGVVVAVAFGEFIIVADSVVFVVVPVRFGSLERLYVVSMESCQENLSWIRM